MTGRYLLELEERSGTHKFTTRHLIKAEDRQKVKYHYHRTLKNWGYTDSQFGTHELRSTGHGSLWADITSIRELSEAEYNFLDEFLFDWTKV